MTQDSLARSMFYVEVASPKATRRSVAICYTWLMAEYFGRQARGEDVTDFWPPIHDKIRERFDISILQIDPIKKAAWENYEAVAALQNQMRSGDV